MFILTKDVKTATSNLWNNRDVNTETLSYINSLENDKKSWFIQVFSEIKKLMPLEIEEGFQYGMPSFYVSFKTYPKGYHVGENIPLPFIALAYQKHYLAVYFMPWMTELTLSHDFKTDYTIRTGKKLNAGKVCLRFRRPDDLPMEWLKKVVKSVSVKEWIERYEKSVRVRDRKSRKTSSQDNHSNM
jgi:hypothetical protein